MGGDACGGEWIGGSRSQVLHMVNSKQQAGSYLSSYVHIYDQTFASNYDFWGLLFSTEEEHQNVQRHGR